MINLIFVTKTRALYMIVIKERTILWNDQQSGLHQLYPTPDIYAIKVGGKPTEEELKEYNMCKTEKELAAFCIRDATQNGSKLIKMQEK